MIKKRVLIITYYWPPSGGSGVQRWLKMAKFIPQFGWEPVIYTPDNVQFVVKDPSLSKSVSANIKIIRKKIWDPAFWFNKKGEGYKIGEVDTTKMSLINKLVVWVRGNLLIPDSKIFWVKPSIKYLTNYLNKNKIDLIVTTGPPHSMHLIGLGLKKELGIKWVADFRDPWSDGDLLLQLKSSKYAISRHLKLERNILNNADLIVTVTEGIGARLQMKAPTAKLKVITNGFDSEDFKYTNPEANKYFTITYSGLLYGKRNPSVLWEVLDEICSVNKDFYNSLRVNMAGVIDSRVEGELKKNKLLFKKLNILGYVPHATSIDLCVASSLLVLPVDNTGNQKILIPGKMFEYFGANVPIIGFGDRDSDAGRLLESVGQNPLISYSDKNETKNMVLGYFDDFLSLSKPKDYKFDQFERKNLAKLMSLEFNDIIK